MWAASSSTASANRSSSSSVVKKPTLIRSASRLGIVRAIAKTRDPSSSSAACGRPAGDPERHQRRHRVARGQDGDAGDRRPGARPPRPPVAVPRRWTKSSPTYIDSQPIERAMPDDRRPVVAGSPRTGGRRATTAASPRAVDALEAEPAAERRDEARRSRAGSTTSAPIPSGPSSHFWAGTRVQVRAELVEPDRDRAGGLGAVDDDQRAAGVGERRRSAATGMTAPVVHRTCEIETSRVPGVIAASNAASVRVVVAVVAGVDEDELDADPVAERVQRPEAAGVLVRGRHDAAAGPPVGQQRGGVHPVGRGVGQGDRADVGAEHGRDAGARLGHPLRGTRRSRRGGRARRRARRSAISAIAAAVSAGSGPTEPVLR